MRQTQSAIIGARIVNEYQLGASYAGWSTTASVHFN